MKGTQKIFELPQVGLGGFLQSIGKLQKKADKLGIGRIQVDVSEAYIKTISNGLFESRVPYVKVTVTGDAPIIEGWVFVAKFDFSGEFGLLVKKVAKDEQIPSRYLEEDGDSHLCEHCNNRRGRIRAYVVKNVETGEWKQVGSSCVKDFTGHVTPEQLARYWGYIDELEDEGFEFPGWHSHEEEGEFLLGEFLTRVACASRIEGFVSKAQVSKNDYGISTADHVLNWIYAKGTKAKRNYEHLVVTAEDAQLAKEAIEWAETLSDKQAWDNEFLHNLRNIARAGTVPIYHTGHAGYMIQAYLKAKGRIEEQKKRAQGSEYYPASVKDRIEVEKVKVSFHTSFDTQFGTTHLYKFKKEGYTFVWFASSGQGLVPGDVVSFKATVKKFEEYKGIKQTIITRAGVKR